MTSILFTDVQSDGSVMVPEPVVVMYPTHVEPLTTKLVMLPSFAQVMAYAGDAWKGLNEMSPKLYVSTKLMTPMRAVARSTVRCIFMCAVCLENIGVC